MQQIATLFKLPTEKVDKGITNERQHLIKQFLDNINRGRIEGNYKPYTARYVATRMGHLKTFELRDFLKDCESKKCFGSYWHWALRVQK